MGTAGAKAFGDALRVNKTLQHLDVSNNSFEKVQVGDQVKLESSGEVCTVTYINFDGSVNVKKADGSTLDYVGRKGKEFEWESQVPAFCAGLAASPSLLSVSDAMWCSGRLLRPFCGVEGCNFLHEKFAQLAVTFFVLGLISSLLGFGGHTAAARAFRLFYTPFDCFKSGNTVLTLLFFVRFILIKIMYTGRRQIQLFG